MPSTLVASSTAQKHLRLHLCSGVGPIRFANLLRELGGVEAVLGASVARLSSVERIGRKLAEDIARDRDRADVETELRLAASRRVRILCQEDDEYPLLLRRIDDPPVCLYVRGTVTRRDAMALAIVGSRHCSRYGAEQAERFGALAANAGLTVVSGMARGTDSCAHRGAIAAGGRTLAVLGCGLCHIYPPDASDLAEEIVSQGALLSELPMEVPPDAKNFPGRNRIIAGLALGVLVVEAARRSGALITARLAAEYNREVFAVPGRVDSIQAEGCHTLIKAGGAKMVTGLEDVLEEFGPAGAAMIEAGAPQTAVHDPATALQVAMDEYELKVFEALESGPAAIEGLCEGTGLPPSRVAVALTGLQLKAAIRPVEGDAYERVGRSAPRA